MLLLPMIVDPWRRATTENSWMIFMFYGDILNLVYVLDRTERLLLLCLMIRFVFLWDDCNIWSRRPKKVWVGWDTSISIPEFIQLIWCWGKILISFRIFTQYKDIGQCGKRRILYSDSDRMRNHLGLVKILSFPWVSSKELFLILFVFKILLSNKCSEQLIWV